MCENSIFSLSVLPVAGCVQPAKSLQVHLRCFGNWNYILFLLAELCWDVNKAHLRKIGISMNCMCMGVGWGVGLGPGYLEPWNHWRLRQFMSMKPEMTDWLENVIFEMSRTSNYKIYFHIPGPRKRLIWCYTLMDHTHPPTWVVSEYHNMYLEIAANRADGDLKAF